MKNSLFNSISKVVAALLRLHGLALILLLAVQFFCLWVLRSQYNMDPFIHADHQPQDLWPFLGLIFGYSFFILALGILFNTRSRTSWLFQLPVHESAFTIIPIGAIGLLGSTFSFLAPWGDFRAGLEMLLFGAPFLCFLIIRSDSSLSSGVVKAGGFAILLFFFWQGLLVEWSVRQEGWQVEFFYLILFAVLCFVIDQRSRGTAGSAIVLLFCVLVGKLAFVARSLPESFKESVLHRAYLKSDKTAREFRRLVMDPESWSSVEAFDFNRFINGRAHLFATELLNGDEQIQFFINIHTNWKLWNEKVMNNNWLSRTGLFHQPRNVFGSDRFPLNSYVADPKLVEYLYANWRDDKPFCDALPIERSSRFVGKLFSSNCPNILSLRHEIWTTYSLSNPTEYEAAIDEWLTEKYSSMHPAMKQRLPQNLFYLDYLEALDRSSRIEMERALNLGALTRAQLKDFKEKIITQRKRLLSVFPTEREEFIKSVWQRSWYRNEESVLDSRSVVLAHILGDSAISEMYRRELQSWSPIDAIRFWLLYPKNQLIGMQRFEIYRLLSDERFWPEIQRIISEVQK